MSQLKTGLKITVRRITKYSTWPGFVCVLLSTAVLDQNFAVRVNPLPLFARWIERRGSLSKGPCSYSYSPFLGEEVLEEFCAEENSRTLTCHPDPESLPLRK